MNIETRLLRIFSFFFFFSRSSYADGFRQLRRTACFSDSETRSSTKDTAYLEAYFHEQALLANTSDITESFHAGLVVSAEVVALESFGVLATVKSKSGAVVNALAIPAQFQLKPKVQKIRVS